MPQFDQASCPSAGTEMESSDAQQILLSIRSLRWTIIRAWQSRAVMLTEGERRTLRDEIDDTCELLTGLTAGEWVGPGR
jgi:hypothetical protein